MLAVIKYLSQGFSEILYPPVCKICGHTLSDTEAHICDLCLSSNFDEAYNGKSSTSDTLLPEGIESQFAMWQFDKGNVLQDLLHDLKYNRLTGIGRDLGRAIGHRVQKFRLINEQDDSVLIPVPLHPARYRKRGYNQAFYIALGVSDVTGITISKPADLIRIKNTQTQTGFSLEKRRKNIHKAFAVRNGQAFKNRTCIIIDDVFTTGATTFELASALLESGARKIMIMTVAQA